MTSSTTWSARMGPPAAIRPTSGTIAVSVALASSDTDSVRRPAQPAASPTPADFAVPVVQGERHQHFHGPRPLGIAPQVAELFQLGELMGHAGQAGQADGVADFPHGRRVAVVVDRTLDGLQDLLLPDGESLGGPLRLRAPLGSLAVGGLCCHVRQRLSVPARPLWLQLPGTSGLKMSDPADQLQKWLFCDFKRRPATRLFQTFVLASLDNVR